MDWQFRVGLGVAVVFGLLPYAVKDLPPWVSWPGVGIGALFIVWGLLPGHSSYPVLPTIAVIVCLGLFSGSAAWFASEWQRQNGSTPFFAECHFGLMPTQSPENRLYVLNVFPTPIANGGGGFGEITKSSDQPFTWPTPGGVPMQAYQCKITNYGLKTIFNIGISFAWVFRKAVPDKDHPSTLRSGEVTLERDWPCQIPKIDPGTANSFIFYISNMSDQFVDVSLPHTILGTTVGENAPTIFKLTVAESRTVNLSPRRP